MFPEYPWTVCLSCTFSNDEACTKDETGRLHMLGNLACIRHKMLIYRHHFDAYRQRNPPYRSRRLKRRNLFGSIFCDPQQNAALGVLLVKAVESWHDFLY